MLVSALHSRAVAIADQVDATEMAVASLDAAVAELHQWAAPSEHPKLACRWHATHGRFATAFEVLNDSVAKAKGPVSKEHIGLKVELLEKLGWNWDEK